MAALLPSALGLLLLHPAGFLPVLAVTLVTSFRLVGMLLSGVVLAGLLTLETTLPGPSSLSLLTVPRSLLARLLRGLATTLSSLPVA